MVPPDPASPNPSAHSSRAPAGGTPRVTSPSAETSISPPSSVPPKTLTVFSMSIDPPIAVSEMVPPALLDELEEASARSPSRGLMPMSLMLPDVTTAFATRRPAVIMIFPAEVEVVLALAETNLPSETSPSDWMISVPPPAPLTSTGLEAAVVTKPTSSPRLPRGQGRARGEGGAGRGASGSPALSHHADPALDEGRHHRAHHLGRVPRGAHQARVVRAAVATAILGAGTHDPDAERTVPG